MNEMKRRMKQMEIKQQGKEVVKQFEGTLFSAGLVDDIRALSTKGN